MGKFVKAKTNRNDNDIQESSLYRMDFTLSIDTRANGWLVSKDGDIQKDVAQLILQMQSIFREDCERWVYQLECTENGQEGGNLHFQGRLNLRRKMRASTYTNLFKECLGPYNKYFYKVFFSHTSRNCYNFDYVMKPETRVAGPWANKDVTELRSILPKEKMLVWHKKYEDMLFDYDSKPINFRILYNCIDTSGGRLKTAFTKRMMHLYEDEVSFLDCWSSPQQLQNSIVAEGPKKMYLFDIPCKFLQGSWNQEQVYKLASLIERVKDGGPFRATMYGGSRTLLFDPPICIVFSNTALGKDCFTPGRLEWDILTDEVCVPIVPEFLKE